jgi:hypothetical protein
MKATRSKIRRQFVYLDADTIAYLGQMTEHGKWPSLGALLRSLIETSVEDDRQANGAWRKLNNAAKRALAEARAVDEVKESSLAQLACRGARSLAQTHHDRVAIIRRAAKLFLDRLLVLDLDARAVSSQRGAAKSALIEASGGSAMTEPNSWSASSSSRKRHHPSARLL